MSTALPSSRDTLLITINTTSTMIPTYPSDTETLTLPPNSRLLKPHPSRRAQPPVYCVRLAP